MKRNYLLKITKGTYYYYKYKVNNNIDETFLSTRKKLTRNWVLGSVTSIGKEYKWKRYGNLFIHLVRTPVTLVMR